MRVNFGALGPWFAVIALCFLGGAGVATAQSVTLTPTTMAFGNQLVNTTSVTRQATLKNGTTIPITISSISTSLPDYTYVTTCPLSPSTLAAGKSCLMKVSFTPSVLGSRRATLTVTDNVTNSPQTSTLTGTGVGPVTVSPATLNFASQPVGTTSAPVSVTVTNNQATVLSISSIASNSADFPETSACPISPATLAAGASCTAAVSFAPTQTGNQTGTLTITDDASSSPQTVALGGRGLVATLVSIAVTPSPASIALGNSQQFTATGTYSNGSSTNLTSSAVWASSLPVVAGVAAGGMATSISQGMATIMATSAAITGSSTLTVTPPTLLSVAVTPGNPVLAAGTTEQLKAIGTYGDGSTQDLTSAATWTAVNPGAATVGSTGLLTAVAAGASSISASAGGITGSTNATVTTAIITSVAVTPAIPVTQAGFTVGFTATGTFSDGTTQNITGTALWSSDTPAVATISNQSGSQGVATAVTPGPANISASAGAVAGSTLLTVGTASLTSITLTPADPVIAAGTGLQLSATGNFSDGSTENLNAAVSWSSGTPSTATINSTGLATGVTAGSTAITASWGSITGVVTLNVSTATLTSIALTPATATIAAGNVQQFAATGTFSDGSAQDLTQVGYWNSAVGSTATVSDAAGSLGLASGLAAGTTTVRVVSNGVTGTATLNISGATLMSIAVNPASASIALGGTQQFTAMGTFSDGSYQDVTEIATWNSSTSGVGVVGNGVGSAGLVTSAGNGTATISASVGAVSGSGQLTVGQSTLVSISVTPANATIASGTTQQYTATGTFSDGSTQDLTASAAWSSNMPSVLGIAAGGLASALSVGGATITATSGSVSGSTGVTVSAPSLISITVSPSTASIPVLSPQQYAATGSYSDGSQQVLTNSVTWTSSAASVATVTAGGLATSGQAGTTTISAMLGAISGSSALTAGVGTVSQQTPVACGNGYPSGSVCTQAVVSCPNTVDMTFTYGVDAGTGAGSILIFNGAGGVIPGGKNYILSFNAVGYTGIQVAWTSTWQDTGLTAKNILTAACRISTVGNYLYANYFSGGGFGVLGGSAGAGAVGYWLGWYGGGNTLDNVEVSSGPVYSDIEQGCEVPEAQAVTIVPTDGSPWTDTPKFRQGQQNGMTTQTGYTCQPTQGTTTQTEDAAWLAQSIVQPGWVNNYPQTSVAGWVCNNALNNSEAEAWLFFQPMASPYALTAISACPDAETVGNGYTPQGVLGSTAITNDMIANTYDKHNR
ncbi:MAG TPA: Ig-like domain-containing protein [Candidatus Sulfotelmatobacter sp.]